MARGTRVHSLWERAAGLRTLNSWGCCMQRTSGAPTFELLHWKMKVLSYPSMVYIHLPLVPVVETH
jgi:hypothetical protein